MSQSASPPSARIDGPCAVLQRNPGEAGEDLARAESLGNGRIELQSHEPQDMPEPTTECIQGRSRSRTRATILALALALFIAALDGTIVATVLPTISSDLNSAAGYIWIGGAYLLGTAAAANIWANLSNIWGRKPILLTVVVVFFASSIICATAVNMAMLIAGRSMQGAAGGGVIQLVTIIISDLFSVRRRSLLLGLLDSVWILAAAIGPVLGGSLTQALSWRWIFWINLPIAGVVFFILIFTLQLHDPKTPIIDGMKSVDWLGGLSILGLSLMLLMGLNFGGVTFSWKSSQVLCLIVFGCVTVPVFIFCEKRLAKLPIMPLTVFKQVSNAACFCLTFANGAVVFGVEWYLPLYFQSTHLSSPLESGVRILPLIITESIMSATAGVIIHRTGRYMEIIWIGNLLVLLGTGLCIDLDAMTSSVKLISYQVVTGLGTGMLFFPPLLALQTNVSEDDTAAATATFGFIRNLASSASIVVAGVIFQNKMTAQSPRLIAAGLPLNVTDALNGRNAAANVLIVGEIDDLQQRRAVQDAFSDSLREVWVLYTAFATVALISSAFIKKKPMSTTHVDTKPGLREV